MSQASEVAILPLKPDIDIDSGDPKTALHSAFGAISKTPGFQNLYYGRQVEHPDVLQLSLDWESVDSFKAFTTSPAFDGFKENLDLVMGGPPQLDFVSRAATTPFSGPVSAPVTEIATLSFPASYVEADFDKNFELFKAKLLETAKGVKGVVGGWSKLQLPPKEEADKDKDKLFVGVIGWETIDAHMAFRDTDGFKEAIPYLKVENLKGIEMHHVKFTKF